MSTYTKGKTTWLSKNFESTEFDCKCKNYCCETEVDPQLVTYLQKIRDHFGTSVRINSAYRCKKHNKSVGGANYSKHLYGQAADIRVEGIKPLKVAQYAESIGIKGIGLYSNFVHIDTRSNKYFWYGNEQKSRKTFGKYIDTTENIVPTIESEKTNVSSKTSMVQLTGGMVNIRKGPGKDYAITGKIARLGDKFEIAKTTGWAPVRNGKEVFWISSKYIDQNNKCTGDIVNLRCGPGTEYDILGKAHKGDILNIVIPGNWWAIMLDDSVYWISGTYAKQI